MLLQLMGIARAIGIFSRSGFALLFAAGFGFGGFLTEDSGVWQQGRVYPFALFI